jgi:hypothetical protein
MQTLEASTSMMRTHSHFNYLQRNGGQGWGGVGAVLEKVCADLGLLFLQSPETARMTGKLQSLRRVVFGKPHVCTYGPGHCSTTSAVCLSVSARGRVRVRRVAMENTYALHALVNLPPPFLFFNHTYPQACKPKLARSHQSIAVTSRGIP